MFGVFFGIGGTDMGCGGTGKVERIYDADYNKGTVCPPNPITIKIPCPGCDDEGCPVPKPRCPTCNNDKGIGIDAPLEQAITVRPCPTCQPKCPACDDTGMVKHTPGYYCKCWWGRARKDWDKDSESDHYEDEYCKLADIEDRQPKEGEDELG